MKTTLIILFLLTVFMTNTFAEHWQYLSIEGHMGKVHTVVFSSDGETLISAGGRGLSNRFTDSIRLWDVNTGQNKQILTGPGNGVSSIALSPNGQILASGNHDYTICLWDVDTATHIATFEEHKSYVSSVAFSPDGKTLASGSGNNTIRLWNANTGELIKILKGHKDYVNSVAFSPDGQTLASGSEDDTIRLWNANTGELIETLKGHRYQSVAFSPDGQILASGSVDDTIRLWNANTGELIKILKGHKDYVNSVAFSPDGQTLASGSIDGTIRLWNVNTGEPLNTLEGHKDREGHKHRVYSVAFSPDGKTLASGGSISTSRGWKGTIGLWDLVSSQHKYSIFRHHATDLAFSPDGQTLASGGDRVILWDPITRHQKQVLNTAGDRIAFSPDGQILAFGNSTGPIHLWDPNTGKLQDTFTLPTYTNNPRINSFVFSPDGQTLASVGDGITLWNVNKGWEKAWRRFSGRALSFSPDGQILATTSGNAPTRLWDANTLQHKYNLDRGDDANSIAFSPDGRTIAGNSGDRIYLWDAKTGQMKKISDNPNNWYTSDIVYSPDGQTIVTRAAQAGFSTINLWDANTGQYKTTLTGTHVANASRFIDSTGIVFSPDGRTIASGGEDSIILLWKLPDTRVNITPYPVASPAIGEQFTVNLSILEGKNVGGYQLTVGFNETLLRYVESANGNYLPPGSFFVPPVVSENSVTLGATSLTGTSNGDGTLATVTFEVLEVKESPIALSDLILTDRTGKHLSVLTNSGRIDPTLSSTSAVVDLTPSSVLAPAIGEQLAFNIRISDGQNVAGYQISLEYDIDALKPVLASDGAYLPEASPAKPLISEGLVTLGASSSTGVGNGDGMLATITFEILAVQASNVDVSGYLTTPNGLRSNPIFKDAKVIVALLGDVNRDGTANILDLVLVASSFGQQVPETGNPADVNEDGVVNIVDLVKVAGAIGGDAAAPALHPQALAAFAAADVQKWLTQAQQVDMNDAISQRGIRFLEQLLTALIPKETALLVNYPNPFNPETWIPYQLAEPADVTLTIYAINGTVVRTLALGHQPVGIYQDKSRAAYWDGRNELGESVASGVYFYTLTAGDFAATRKMLIRK